MKEKKGRLISRNYYKIATELRVHHLALNPEGRQPITTANIIANIQLHAYNFLSKQSWFDGQSECIHYVSYLQTISLPFMTHWYNGVLNHGY